MAASRIKGITVEIGGDTTKLQTALKSVNSEIKNRKKAVQFRRMSHGDTGSVLQTERSALLTAVFLDMRKARTERLWWCRSRQKR